jgi:hypothetical protein
MQKPSVNALGAKSQEWESETRFTDCYSRFLENESKPTVRKTRFLGIMPIGDAIRAVLKALQGLGARIFPENATQQGNQFYPIGNIKELSTPRAAVLFLT